MIEDQLDELRRDVRDLREFLTKLLERGEPRRGSEWICVAEAALRASCHVSTIRGAARRGEVEAGRVGGRLRVRVASLDAWLLRGQGDAVADPEAVARGLAGK
jgi:excisionase family DNA binding protein